MWLRTGNRDAAIDGPLLRPPYVGPLMRMFATSQLARSLSTLLAGGLPLVNALEVAASSVGNRAMGVAVLPCMAAMSETARSLPDGIGG